MNLRENKMTPSPIEEIKNRLDIVEVVGNYLKLQKTGANYRALCPFHSEKKPSLFVSPARQIWHCFGCGKGGSIFNFVMEIEGIEFGDALRILAQKAGVRLRKEETKLRTERKLLYEICELASRFFEKQLRESLAGKEAQKYLFQRGISEISLTKWRIGYAPNTWHGLTDFLESRGYSKEEIQKTGLGILTEEGNFYDRFRGRIIFPIFDLNSQVIGFGGRYFENPLRISLSEEEQLAKYINTPQTLLYDKSRVLYGLDKAKVEIRKKDFCILVEGYLDAILNWQAGWGNVVATSGTALTPFQLNLLKRYSDNLLTAFDMDIAGDSATKRGIELARQRGFNIKVIIMPNEKDPAEIIAQDSQAWSKMVSQAKSILEFYFETTFVRFDSQTAEGKREIAKILLPVIKRIPNKIEQFHWVQELARKLAVKEESIEEELKKLSLPSREASSEEEIIEEGKESLLKGRGKSRKELLEERIGALILKNPQMINLVSEDCFSLFSPFLRTFLADLKENPHQDFSLKMNEKTEGEKEFLNYLFLKAEVEEEEDVDPLEEIQICLREIRCLEIKNKLDEVSQNLKKAEIENDLEKVNSLTQEFNKLANKLINL